MSSTANDRSNDDQHKANGHKKKSHGNNPSAYGNKEELKGLVFSYGGPGQVDQYLRTVKGLEYYFGTEWGPEYRNLVIDGTDPTYEEPAEPDRTATVGALERYRAEIRMILEQQQKFKKKKGQVFYIILGQCTPTMKAKLESLQNFPTLKSTNDVAGLMKAIKNLVYATDGVVYPAMAMQAKLRTLFTMSQGPNEPLHVFFQRFKQQYEATERVWGPLIPTRHHDDESEEAEEAPEVWQARFAACLFLAGVNRQRFKPTLDALHNDYQLGKVSYPQDLPSMVAYLTNRRGVGGGTTQRMEDMQDGIPTAVSLTQIGGGGKGKKKGDGGKDTDEASVSTSKSAKSNKSERSNRFNTEGRGDDRPPHWAY